MCCIILHHPQKIASSSPSDILIRMKRSVGMRSVSEVPSLRLVEEVGMVVAWGGVGVVISRILSNCIICNSIIDTGSHVK